MNSRLIIGILIILVGVSFLINFPVFKFVFALFIIWIGIKVLTGNREKFEFQSIGETEEDKISRILIFSGINRRFLSKNFRGGEVVAIFGGGDIDLSKVNTEEKEITLDVVAIFSGLRVKVPDAWTIKSEGVGIVGGFNNNTKQKGKRIVTVAVKGIAIFGGVDIVN